MKPTKARLDLLQAIADGAVWRHFPLGMVATYDEWDHGPGTERRRQTVTARVAPLETDGLVKLMPASTSTFKESRRWDLTPAGRMYLEANGGAA